MAIERTVTLQTTTDVTGRLTLDFVPRAQVEHMLQSGTPRVDEAGAPVPNAWGKPEYDLVPGTRYSLSYDDPELLRTLMGQATAVLVGEAMRRQAASAGLDAPTGAEVLAVVQAMATDGIDLHHALVAPAEALAGQYWSQGVPGVRYRRWDG